MLREDEKDQAAAGSWKYSRSMSWTERPPRKSSTKPQWNSKARSCLPPLQPLSIVRSSIEEWPRAGSDDPGIWPNPPTPGAKRGSLTPRESSTSEQPPIEFEFRKDKLAFFNKECSRILDHVYLGSDAIAKDREILRQNGITHVLNCVGFVSPEYFKNELVYKTLWLQDCPSEDITSILYDVFDYFEDVREQGGRVLVHCSQGVSRSSSLVIAYLMWKEGQSFDDAFQHVKAARGVTNPNVGFACQLLQCQKRVHALPASPTSVLRIYRMAPHSPYDPLHLVPKLLSEPGLEKLDSRGAFIIHIPSALYVWTGKHCSTMMSDNARAAASQVIRYERAQGPVLNVKEGEETIEFWDALTYRKYLGCNMNFEEKKSAGRDMVPATAHPCPGQRKLDEYDVDFEILHRALAGGVVPPCPLSEAGSETCLPARENGWNRLRRKFATGIVKEFITASRKNSSVLQACDQLKLDTCKEVEDLGPPDDNAMPSNPRCDSLDSFVSYVTSSQHCPENDLRKEVVLLDPLSNSSISQSPSFNLVDSLSSFLVGNSKSNSTSPSVSPSTSDYSSSFTFSPSPSNCSDQSFASAQPSPRGLESKDIDRNKNGPAGESIDYIDNSTCILDGATSPRREDRISASHASRGTSLYLTHGVAPPSIAERRGSNLPSQMILPSIAEASQIPDNLTRFLENDVMRDAGSGNLCREVSFEMDGKEPILSANSFVVDDEILGRQHDEKKCGTFHLASDDMINKIGEATKLVLYQWPSMDKLDMNSGRHVSSKGNHNELISNDGEREDSLAHLETVGRNLLSKKGFSTDAHVKIVEEGKEPVQLLKHLAQFSIGKSCEGFRVSE